MLVGNMDGHAKNLSLITIGKRTRLAPFYDLVCTTVYPNLSQKPATMADAPPLGSFR
jgi:serine/threonine-protein kinase HipA